MSNEAGPFPPGYDPKQEVNELLGGQAQHEINPDTEQFFLEVMDTETSYVATINTLLEYLAKESHSADSTLDKPELTEIYHDLQNKLGLADNTRRFFGKSLDHERHGGNIDQSPEIIEQQQRIAYELEGLAANALDPETKRVLDEALQRLRNKF